MKSTVESFVKRHGKDASRVGSKTVSDRLIAWVGKDRTRYLQTNSFLNGLVFGLSGGGFLGKSIDIHRSDDNNNNTVNQTVLFGNSAKDIGERLVAAVKKVTPGTRSQAYTAGFQMGSELERGLKGAERTYATMLFRSVQSAFLIDAPFEQPSLADLMRAHAAELNDDDNNNNSWSLLVPTHGGGGEQSVWFAANQAELDRIVREHMVQRLGHGEDDVLTAMSGRVYQLCDNGTTLVVNERLSAKVTPSLDSVSCLLD